MIMVHTDCILFGVPPPREDLDGGESGNQVVQVNHL